MHGRYSFHFDEYEYTYLILLISWVCEAMQCKQVLCVLERLVLLRSMTLFLRQWIKLDTSNTSFSPHSFITIWFPSLHGVIPSPIHTLPRRITTLFYALSHLIKGDIPTLEVMGILNFGACLRAPFPCVPSYNFF